MRDKIYEIDLKKKTRIRKSMSPTARIHEIKEKSALFKLIKNDPGEETGRLSLIDNDNDQEENFQDVKLFFGEMAKDNFWNLYKSQRVFKDFDQQQDVIQDPRFAYLQACAKLKVNPKASMIIRDKQTTNFNFTNQTLLGKSARAIADMIHIYQLPIQQIFFTNNGLQPKDCILLIDSLQQQYQQLSKLTISKNKLGLQGAKHLAAVIPLMKNLKYIDLSHNDIGDTGISFILKSLKAQASIQYLDLSGNGIGKTAQSSETLDVLSDFLYGNNMLETLKLNWNNLRGEKSEKIIDTLVSMNHLKEVELNNNLLGMASEGKVAPINKLSDVLIKTNSLEKIDLSYNFIDQKSIFCIAHGLKFTSSLKEINVEGNPIGPVGLRFMIQAMNSNQLSSFKVSMKEIAADRDISIYKQVFDIQNPERDYSLNLNETYDQIILQHLLTLAEKSSVKSEGKFEMKSCFHQAKLNQKPNWTIPANKDKNGEYELEQGGNLTFHFTINPVQFKQQQMKVQQLPDSPVKGGIQEHSFQEILEPEFLQKPIISNEGFERFVDLLCQSYKDNDDTQIEGIVRNLCKDYMIWSYQASEILYAIKDEEFFPKIASCLLNNIVDRHQRFIIVSHYQATMEGQLTKIKKEMKQSLRFNYWNPSDHYELNLSNQKERDIALTLMVIDKENQLKIQQGLQSDRSQRGNKSCFRNEKLNGRLFVMGDDFRLPDSGTFEFDFIYLYPRPNSQNIIKAQDLQTLLNWFQYKHAEEGVDPLELAYSFSSISDSLVLNSEQLAQIIDLIDDSKWKAQVYISGVPRIVDYKNYDFIKHRIKFPDAIREIYKRFGILNLFNPFRPNGSYRLDLSLYEEKIVCKMLLELAKGEGIGQMTNVHMDGKLVDPINKEFIDKLGDKGIFEGTYICQQQFIKEELRMKLGIKYLDWESIQSQ